MSIHRQPASFPSHAPIGEILETKVNETVNEIVSMSAFRGEEARKRKRAESRQGNENTPFVSCFVYFPAPP
jgi:hypothetical protein